MTIYLLTVFNFYDIMGIINYNNYLSKFSKLIKGIFNGRY